MTEDISSEPVGLKCPACSEPPMLLFGGGTQAICGTDDCPILTWNPTKSRAELNADSKVISLPHLDTGGPVPDSTEGEQ